MMSKARVSLLRDIYELAKKYYLINLRETRRPGAYQYERNKDTYQTRKLHQQGFYIREIRDHVSSYFFLLSSRVRLALLAAQGININPQLLYQGHPINQYKLLFFGSVPTLRSRSRVDLGEFFNKQGCIGLADLRLVCKYRHGLYFCSKAASVKFDLHYELQYKLVTNSYLVQVRLHQLSSTSTARMRLRSSYRLYLRVASIRVDSLSYRSC